MKEVNSSRCLHIFCGINRLVRGDGEIIEEIVSKERQKEINKVSSIHPYIFTSWKNKLALRCHRVNFNL